MSEGAIAVGLVAMLILLTFGLVTYTIYWFAREVDEGAIEKPDKPPKRKKKVKLSTEQEALEYLTRIVEIDREYRISPMEPSLDDRLQAVTRGEQGNVATEVGKNYMSTEITPLLNWLLTDEGISESAMTLAKYNVTMLRVKNALENSIELSNKVSEPVRQEVREIMYSTYAALQEEKERVDYRKALDKQAIGDSIARDLQIEKDFVKNNLDAKFKK